VVSHKTRFTFTLPACGCGYRSCYVNLYRAQQLFW